MRDVADAHVSGISMALPPAVLRCVVFVITMLLNRTKCSLQYEEQARQSWKRIQRAQHRSMVCQSITVLLLVNLSIAQADRLPGGIRKAAIGNTGAFFFKPSNIQPSDYWVKPRESLW